MGDSPTAQDPIAVILTRKQWNNLRLTVEQGMLRLLDKHPERYHQTAWQILECCQRIAKAMGDEEMLAYYAKVLEKQLKKERGQK